MLLIMLREVCTERSTSVDFAQKQKAWFSADQKGRKSAKTKLTGQEKKIQELDKKFSILCNRQNFECSPIDGFGFCERENELKSLILVDCNKNQKCIYLPIFKNILSELKEIPFKLERKSKQYLRRTSFQLQDFILWNLNSQ